MNCEKIREMLDDYHYGELEAKQADVVAKHLMDCASCRKELSRLEAETKIYEDYGSRTERELELPAEVWHRTIARTAAGRQTSSVTWQTRTARIWHRVLPASSWARQALAAALLVAISVAGTLFIVDRYRSQEKPAAVATAGDKSFESALESIQRAEQEYIKAIQELNAIVEKQKPTLDPKVVAELQISLEMVDRNIAATRKAYYAHPKDAELALYMLAAYSRKVELLQDLTS